MIKNNTERKNTMGKTFRFDPDEYDENQISAAEAKRRRKSARIKRKLQDQNLVSVEESEKEKEVDKFR